MQRIRYLVRGHGYGHAATDLPILRSLKRLDPQLQVSIASYGTGLEYFELQSTPCDDLGISDESDFSRSAMLRVLDLLIEDRPDFVVADEIVFAPLLCNKLQIPCLYITHWFYNDLGAPQHDMPLVHADAVVIVDFEAAHTPPADIDPLRIHFVGPMSRLLNTSKHDARNQLEIPDSEKVAVLTLGSIAPFKRADVINATRLYIEAWRLRADRRARLYVLVHPSMQSAIPDVTDDASIGWVGITPLADLYYAAADTVLAGSSLNSLTLLAENGLPGVIFTSQENPVESFHAQFFHQLGLPNLRLIGADTSTHIVARHIDSCLSIRSRHKRSDLKWAQPEDIATIISSHINVPTGPNPEMYTT